MILVSYPLPRPRAKYLKSLAGLGYARIDSMDTKTKKASTPVPYTGKLPRYNPENGEYKGRSHRKGGQRVRDLRAKLITE